MGSGKRVREIKKKKRSFEKKKVQRQKKVGVEVARNARQIDNETVNLERGRKKLRTFVIVTDLVK